MKQRSFEWKQARLGKPSASNLDKICAEGRGGKQSSTREDYLYDLAIERMTGIPRETINTEWMDRGVELEAMARAEYEIELGLIVDEDGGKENLGLWASPDGLVSLDGSIEIKCPKPKNHIKNIIDGIDRGYMLQMAGVMLVYARQWCDFISFCPDFPESLRIHVFRVTWENLADVKITKEYIIENVRAFNIELDELVKKLSTLETNK